MPGDLGSFLHSKASEEISHLTFEYLRQQGYLRVIHPSKHGFDIGEGTAGGVSTLALAFTLLGVLGKVSRDPYFAHPLAHQIF